jgi:hypothetical protein
MSRTSNAPTVLSKDGLLRGDQLFQRLSRVASATVAEIPQQGRPGVGAIRALRPLGSFEEFFWLIDQNRPGHFALAAKVQGATTFGQWRNAFDLVQRRHPLLSVCIETNGNSRPYFCRNIAAPIPLRVIQDNDATLRWKLEMEVELSVPFDPEDAPLVRAVLLHEPDQAVIILVAHHSVADGRSIAFVIRDLLRALSGEDVDALPLLPSHEEILGLTRINAIQPLQQSIAPTPARPSTYIREEQSRPRIKGLHLSSALTSTLRERARREKTTVHGALSAALALAARQNNPHLKDASIRICSPIDTRKLLGLGEDCAALIDAAIVTIEPRRFNNFWDIARESISDLADARTLQGVTASRNALHQATKNGIDVPTAAAICAQAFAHEIMLTNIGKLPYGREFGQLRLETMWGPAVSARFEGATTVGVATANGALCLLETSFSTCSLLKATEQLLVSAI